MKIRGVRFVVQVSTNVHVKLEGVFLKHSITIYLGLIYKRIFNVLANKHVSVAVNPHRRPFQMERATHISNIHSMPKCFSLPSSFNPIEVIRQIPPISGKQEQHYNAEGHGTTTTQTKSGFVSWPPHCCSCYDLRSRSESRSNPSMRSSERG